MPGILILVEHDLEDVVRGAQQSVVNAFNHSQQAVEEWAHNAQAAVALVQQSISDAVSGSVRTVDGWRHSIEEWLGSIEGAAS
eukprot:4370676-Prymnesium_polylepis.1